MNLKISFRYPGVAYDPDSGKFYKLFTNESSTVVSVEREIILDDFLNIIYKCFYTKKKIKKKAEILAWEIMHGPVPENSLLYFKNFNKEDIRASNIGCMTKDEYRSIKDQLDNLHGAIQMKPHPFNAFMYRIEYKYNGKIKHKVVHDITAAFRLKKILLLRAKRILGKYYTSL